MGAFDRAGRWVVAMASGSPRGLEPPLRPRDEDVIAAMAARLYPVPVEVPVVVGLRRAENPGEWNDLIGVIGGGLSLWFRGTTDPGRAPMDGSGRLAVHPAGVARVVPGYWPGFFRWHFHRGDRKHPCLGQAGVCAFERWNGGSWDRYPRGSRGFNLHRSRWSGVPSRVGDYSHGCAVIPDRLEHWALMSALGFPDPPWSAEQTAQRFDYCLIDWGDA